ncbi:MAG: HAMP domain-containing histidine kinase, partial [Lachnospiraceae bacterium]|nr:HAMP domain-containing histidine kinase [Lachnospiraceae bacterium]
REYLENDGLPETDTEPENNPDEDNPDEEIPEEIPEDIPGDMTQRRKLRLSTFYSVVFSAEGEVLTVNNDDPSEVSNEVLTEMAESFLNTGKSYGVARNMIYLISEEDYILVSMMDNTLVSESMYTLLRYTVIFGIIAIVVVLILSIFLANRIIRPLEDNYKRQNQFISDAGHELKTPVSTISANAELLQREIGRNRWLENICYENGRMMEIVCSLLDLIRAESTRPLMERVDLSRLVTAAALPFEAKAFEQGVAFSCEISENLFITGNSQQLEKLVSILIDNAFSHVCSSGQISVSLCPRSSMEIGTGKGTVVLTVANEGEPIPEEDQDKIFVRFYRVDSSRTIADRDENAHYGLGLSIAKAIAAAHRAKISVSCRNGITAFQVVFSMKTK